MSDPRQKIKKLIRLAHDQKGKPEGANALKLARKLIKEHGLEAEFIRRPKHQEFDNKLNQVVDGLKDLFKVK